MTMCWLYIIHTLCNNYNANKIASLAPTPMGTKLKGAKQIYIGTLLTNYLHLLTESLAN